MVNLVELRDEIMREVYREAVPGLDWDNLVENPEEYSDEWYDDHYLDSEREREIFDEHTEDVDLTQSEYASLTFTCITDLGPRDTPVED